MFNKERYERLRNPFLYARQRLRMSQKEVATYLGVSDQAIRRAEQGTFNVVPDHYVSGLNVLLKNAGELPIKDDDFDDWRYALRYTLRPLVPPLPHDIPGFISPMRGGPHPFYVFRVQMLKNAQSVGIATRAATLTSISGFAKLVAIAPDSVLEFEASYGGPPGYVSELLSDLNVNPAELVRGVPTAMSAAGGSDD